MIRLIKLSSLWIVLSVSTVSLATKENINLKEGIYTPHGSSSSSFPTPILGKWLINSLPSELTFEFNAFQQIAIKRASAPSQNTLILYAVGEVYGTYYPIDFFQCNEHNKECLPLTADLPTNIKINIQNRTGFSLSIESKSNDQKLLYFATFAHVCSLYSDELENDE